MEGVFRKAWVDTTAFTVTYDACEKAAHAVVNGPETCTAFFQNMSWDLILRESEARGRFRGAITLYTGGIIFAKLVYAVAWTVIGAIALLFDSDKPFEFAVRNYIQVASSIVNLAIAVIGCMRPIWAIKLMDLSIQMVEGIDPKVFEAIKSIREEANAAMPQIGEKFGAKHFSKMYQAA